MPKPWTKKRLEELRHKELSTLYERALTMDSDDARDCGDGHIATADGIS